jgi:hypothetical protein
MNDEMNDNIRRRLKRGHVQWTDAPDDEPEDEPESQSHGSVDGGTGRNQRLPESPVSMDGLMRRARDKRRANRDNY